MKEARGISTVTVPLGKKIAIVIINVILNL